ncbi:preprotein translocase subunit SecG [Rhabdochlamydiaceae symbiont of Dictyostelium giganteum]|uniref:preprotein translocase subunit SecG n=1 Tax=Rhabdochlamydiaceae symbiont of Dictyostelium giganteum TaxID=3342349 RepID=UPI00384C8AF7
MTPLFSIAIFLFMMLSVVICLVVLVQESKSLGLGASFGGDPSESVFGTSTAAVLKTVTAYLAVIFMVSCVVLSAWSSSSSRKKSDTFPQVTEQLSPEE